MMKEVRQHDARFVRWHASRLGSQLGLWPVQQGFSWDPVKEGANVRKHGVSFREAMTAFADPFSVTVHDPNHSVYEARYVLVGLSSRGRLLVVAHAELPAQIRIISARPATRRERHAYEEEA